jgi:hypothetical protein
VCAVPFYVLGHTVWICTVRTTGSLGTIFEAAFGIEIEAFSGEFLAAAGPYCAGCTSLCRAHFSRHKFGGGRTTVRTWAHFPRQNFWHCFVVAMRCFPWLKMCICCCTVLSRTLNNISLSLVGFPHIGVFLGICLNF